MAKIGKQPSGILTMKKMMGSAATLFLEKGYSHTTTAEIAKKAGMTGSSFFRAFENKEAVLLALVESMFGSQFEMAENDDPLMVYATEIAIQMNITEYTEPFRDLYVTAYSLPTTSEYIYQNTSEKLKFIFREFMPEATDRDFYELDIASAGITRGYMAKPCDRDFTIEQKLRRYIRCCMVLYNVPEDRIAQVTEKVLQIDTAGMAERVINAAIERFEVEFERVRAIKHASKPED